MSLESSIALLRHLTVLTLVALVPSSAALSFIYNGFQHAADLSLDGSASILRGGALQLTNDSNNLMGHAFFAAPVPMLVNKAVISFSTAFVFDIVTVGRSGGHGLAFVVAASKVLPGASDEQYLGLLGKGNLGNSSNHVFAVELDTVQANGLLNETNANHVGVDLNSLVSNVSEPAAYFTDDDGRSVSVPLESAQPIQAWVDYDGSAKVLNVTIAPASLQTRPRRPLISQVIDLSPIFKEDMYVGFSAATGKLASSHYVLAWSFRTDGVAQAIDLSRLPKVPKAPAPPPSTSTIIKIVALSCAATLVMVVAAIGAAFWLRRRAALAETLEEWELDHPHRLPYKELYKATKGFKNSELLGAGGFGQVYRGVLRRSGDTVAIRRISSNGSQGMREFVAEVASLGRMRHRNLVELRGWCKHGQDLLLVYDFMPNGSLDAHLFGSAGAGAGVGVSPSPALLTWEQRLRILRGVASGLVYLHEGWEQVVVHRDVKASNVLLGADMSARLGDFGLARLYEHGAEPATTRVVGTLGYMAPELTVTGKATTASDVFGFGGLLLEVASGRRPIDPITGVNLVRWVRDHGVKGDLVRAVDERLDGWYDKEEARLVLWLGLACSQWRPEARPSMRQVCQYLNGEEEMQEDAVLVFSDVDSIDFGSLTSLTWSSSCQSCATMSAGSLRRGR
ncbi:L-type lectin-domain containing receptor kinase SIT2-like [Triticum dicoccoides]|uniref:L-type lectin-domain containing receptor kinase SIT2-like n=1 Tax=Triticum dicoccoides TaxID=85692 RepID=UPI00162E0A57|nr:L-type lectin-domain containing receptor kinase SIT2-like [Triticum dicoccoides]